MQATIEEPVGSGFKSRRKRTFYAEKKPKWVSLPANVNSPILTEHNHYMHIAYLSCLQLCVIVEWTKFIFEEGGVRIKNGDNDFLTNFLENILFMIFIVRSTRTSTVQLRFAMSFAHKDFSSKAQGQDCQLATSLIVRYIQVDLHLIFVLSSVGKPNV